ncbi:PREDICTED: uncharacterized protein LOC109356221 [Lupinus angustifolius]|uniref:uncharacterized protein LOC109356221 n=1 Tax=Lupinus angustifolius TaxID=3871 RepID=UPI00092E35B3|nr:PREDICTED: uncharacterized protein LOC109356221 [Lupinus angustifolius]
MKKVICARNTNVKLSVEWMKNLLDTLMKLFNEFESSMKKKELEWHQQDNGPSIDESCTQATHNIPEVHEHIGPKEKELDGSLTSLPIEEHIHVLKKVKVVKSKHNKNISKPLSKSKGSLGDEASKKIKFYTHLVKHV